MNERSIQSIPYAMLRGAENMALDEALLESSSDRVILRLYGWSPPTISLGRFQYPDAETREAIETFAAAKGFDIVRRSTGGGAILHHSELTYSLVCPLTHWLLTDGREEFYRRSHRAWIAAIGDTLEAAPALSVAEDSIRETINGDALLCFSRRTDFDVISQDASQAVAELPQAMMPVGGIPFGKVIGSAQRRSKTTLLQHGSIKIGQSYEGGWTRPLCDEVPDIRELAETLTPRFIQALGFESSDSGSLDALFERAAEIAEAKFGNASWNWRAKKGEACKAKRHDV